MTSTRLTSNSDANTPNNSLISASIKCYVKWMIPHPVERPDAEVDHDADDDNDEGDGDDNVRENRGGSLSTYLLLCTGEGGGTGGTGGEGGRFLMQQSHIHGRNFGIHFGDIGRTYDIGKNIEYIFHNTSSSKDTCLLCIVCHTYNSPSSRSPPSPLNLQRYQSLKQRTHQLLMNMLLSKAYPVQSTYSTMNTHLSKALMVSHRRYVSSKVTAV
ncbi:hypothetical protein BBBOND_0312110 [Babesia bigemina]|uniref:Uncharacterized protein n=1 Tax=Babesia bigemina TaxID=5866 RepID=A0A061D9Y1_BABBI|nr:hypothetical protein BBBOND_0312110 [Babesia bigemina]CDR97308.1 hypothetical protein BBBOND_0312110 [Babesia bigemina]|eukprot:XP_012769494.1 hypothetical protein BBBOND_0312110 [Babesia bigemina]